MAMDFSTLFLRRRGSFPPPEAIEALRSRVVECFWIVRTRQRRLQHAGHAVMWCGIGFDSAYFQQAKGRSTLHVTMQLGHRVTNGLKRSRRDGEFIDQGAVQHAEHICWLLRQ